MANIMVLGSGGWGTALAVTLQCYGNEVTLWSPFEEEIARLLSKRENEKLLPGVCIPGAIALTTSLVGAEQADLLVLAVPSFAVRQTARRLKGLVRPGQVVVNVSKGIEYETLSLLSTVVEQELPAVRVAALSGPSHAEEVARQVPTTLVSASDDRDAAMLVQDLVMNDTLRVYTNDDIVGVQLAGALKNIIAVAAGCLYGLGLGDNTKAALITRGLSEIARLGKHMGAHESTFAGLAGVGDLVVTCTSEHSRNRHFGLLLGQGYSVEEALERVGMTVEGYHACKAAYKLARREGVEMPITEQCYRVLYERENVSSAIGRLMARPKKHEVENPWVGQL